MVGQQLGGKLVSLGHQVVLGTRNPGDLESKKGMGESLGNWEKGLGRGAKIATFAEAAKSGEIIINATSGLVSLEALKLAGPANLAGKVLVDVSNMLDFSHGIPPSCSATDKEGGSMGELIQKNFPTTKVVKTFNTVNAFVMVAPQQLANGDHTIFLCGNDSKAKETVTGLLRSFGWKDIFDLGDITASRSVEMFFPIWGRFWKQLGNRPFNVKLVR